MCESERLPATDYGFSDLEEALDGEDLRSEDIADVEHWVSVYTELVGFTRTVLEPPAEESLEDGTATSDQHPPESDLVVHRALVQELHLAYWTDRLTRLRTSSRAAPEDSSSAGQGHTAKEPGQTS